MGLRANMMWAVIRNNYLDYCTNARSNNKVIVISKKMLSVSKLQLTFVSEKGHNKWKIDVRFYGPCVI